MSSRTTTTPPRAFLAFLVLVAGSLVGTTAGAADAATSTEFAFSGTAWGSEVRAGSTVKSGPTAIATLGCSTVPDRTDTNNTLATNLANGSTSYGTTGTTVDTVNAAIVDGLYRTTSDSDVQAAKVLGTTITADAMHATARAYSNGTGNGEATFVNLRVLGLPVTATPAPNTKLSLGTLGYVILNEQAFSYNKPVTTMSVTAMHVHLVSSPSAVTPVDIRIGYAQAKIDGPIAAVMEGYAYGSNAKVASGIIESGKTSEVKLPCHGTKGVPRTATVASMLLPDLLSSGTNESSAVGNITTTETTATVTNRIQGVSLLGGRITADALKTELSGVRPDGGTQVLTDNTEFVNLTIDGQPFGGTPAKNTKITVDGLGTVYLHRVVKLASGITEVRSIEIVLATSMGKLPLGTHVKVGVVGLSLHD